MVDLYEGVGGGGGGGECRVKQVLITYETHAYAQLSVPLLTQAVRRVFLFLIY